MAFKRTLYWHSKDDYPYPGSPELSGERIITYSEIYKDKPEMAFRIIDGQFLNICNEVTFWAYLNEPKPEKGEVDDGI